LTQPLDPLTVQRLAFIRFLYEQGVSQADQPEPVSATAVLSFQDAIELFLRLAAEHLHVNLPTDIKFAEYWAKLEPALPAQTQLPSKNAMDRMNKLRVAFKHHGTIPSRTAIEQARGDVTTFFTDATPLVYGIDFVRIDLIDMVTRNETAQLLRDAQTHADASDYVAAMAGLVIAFDDLLDHYAQRRYINSGDPFSFGPTLREFRAPVHPPFKEISHFVEVSKVTVAMQRALRMIALGVDYRRYVQFEILTPRVNHYMGGSTRYTVTAVQQNLTEQDYQTCRRFVIESALQAAKADAALDARMQDLQANRLKSGVSPTSIEREWTGPA
jgi:hypothetical protein